MRKKFVKLSCLAMVFLGSACAMHNNIAEGQQNASATATPAGPTVSPIQSPKRPYNLPIHSPVMLGGSDARSKLFNDQHVRTIFAAAAKLVKSGLEFKERGSHKLDPSRLFLMYETEYPVRVYFIAEGAGYRNSLGYSLTLAGNDNAGAMKLIFPNASLPVKKGTNITIDNLLARHVDEPLHPGDFVELGHMLPGTQIDFFLVRDGARGNFEIFTNHEEDNPDKFQHMFAMVIPDSPFLLIGFEDLVGGGDKDYEDVLFVVDIGLKNAKTFDEPMKLPN